MKIGVIISSNDAETCWNDLWKDLQKKFSPHFRLAGAGLSWDYGKNCDALIGIK